MAQRRIEADFALSIPGLGASDIEGLRRRHLFWWSGWKRRHWPANVIRPGLRFYGFSGARDELFVLYEIVRGGSFAYRTRNEFDREVKRLTSRNVGRYDRHWKRLPTARGSGYCTGYVIWAKPLKAVSIACTRRFPQLGWLNLADAPMADSEALDNFAEGDPRIRSHLSYERNAALKAAAKSYWRNRLGTLCCIVCGFAFEKKYGTLGADVIDMHHEIPLSKTRKRRKAGPKDLLPVCSNCHRIIHRNPQQPLTTVKLKRLLVRTNNDV